MNGTRATSAASWGEYVRDWLILVLIGLAQWLAVAWLIGRIVNAFRRRKRGADDSVTSA